MRLVMAGMALSVAAPATAQDVQPDGPDIVVTAGDLRDRLPRQQSLLPYSAGGRVPSRITRNTGYASGRACFVVTQMTFVRPTTRSMMAV